MVDFLLPSAATRAAASAPVRTLLHPCAAYARQYPGIRQAEDINRCQPESVYYNAPCTAETIDCLLFRKWQFEIEQSTLRALLVSTPPETAPAAQRVAWCREVIASIERALDSTNVKDVWLLGGTVPVDVQETADLGTLPEALWPQTRALIHDLTREAVAAYTPQVSFPRGLGLRIFHTPNDFAVNVSSMARTASGSSGGVRGLGATAVPTAAREAGSGRVICGVPGVPSQFGAASGAPNPRRGDATPLPAAVRSQLEARGFQLNPWRLSDFEALGPAILETYFTLVPRGSGGAALVEVQRSGVPTSLGERRAEVVMHCDTFTGIGGKGPSASTWMRYYATLARDVLATPYEVYVLFGVEQWANNLTVWAQRGRLALPVESFRNLAREAATARSRAFAGAGFSIATSIVSVANPIAGLVVGLVGMLIDVIAAAGGLAVGGWNCPPSLARRSASGDCDFTKLLGPEAAERAQKQREGMETYFSDRTGGPLHPDAGSSWMPWLAGAGALVGGLGLAYALFKRR